MTSVSTDEVVLMINCQVSDQPKVGPAASQTITKPMVMTEAPPRPTCRSHQLANEEMYQPLFSTFVT